MNAKASGWTDPIVLEGEGVRLEPLDLGRHEAGLREIAYDDDLWQWTLVRIRTDEQLRHYLDDALAAWSHGHSLPFVTHDKRSGRIAGMTRFLNVDPAHRKLEIGWTWLGRPFQRSHVNTEAKYLQMRHAFETLGCVRVELKTNLLNTRSRNAMKRLGCVEEGVLRRSAINDRGEIRDTIFYSVLDDEWPAVKARMERWLEWPLHPREDAPAPAAGP
jgi:RimJ/RimL family protein N-acetyltransferase